MKKYICLKCGNIKERLQDKRKRLECKNCRYKYNKEYRNKNKDKLKLKKSLYRKNNPHKWRNRNLVNNYGITLDDYNKLLNKQGEVCFLCKKSETSQSTRYKNLCTDHNHYTKRVRGLLCNKCNRALGLVDENIDILQRMIDYLIEDKNNTKNIKDTTESNYESI